MDCETSTNLVFSLVLATVSRTKEVERFLQSLAEQRFPNIQLIVVDQNDDDRLAAILTRFSGYYQIVHIRSKPGLSIARNVGLQYVRGRIIAFPDDDCWYPRGLLQKVHELLSDNSGWDGVTGMAVDEDSNMTMARFDSVDGIIDRYNVWNRAISFSIFLKAHVVRTVGEFDDRLGVGAGTPWGAGEETDYLIRAISHGMNIKYLTDISVGHPKTSSTSNREIVARTKRYAPGTGFVMRKHRYPVWFALRSPLLSLLGASFALIGGDRRLALVRWTRAKGFVKGWLRCGA